MTSVVSHPFRKEREIEGARGIPGEQAWSGIDVLGKDGSELLNVGAQVELIEDAFAAILGHVGTQPVVFDERFESHDERVEIGRGDEDALDAIRDEFGVAGDRGGDAWDAHRQGFHEDHGKAFSEAGQAKQIGLGIDGADTVLIDGAFEDDAVGEVEALGLSAEGGLVGAVAGQAQTDIATLGNKAAQGIDEEMLAFGRGEATDAENFKDTVRRTREVGGALGWRKEVRIDAEAADVELVPVLIRREVHKLAAGVGADADDEICGGDFVGKVEALGVVKLVGAVDSDGIAEAEDATDEEAD